MVVVCIAAGANAPAEGLISDLETAGVMSWVVWVAMCGFPLQVHGEVPGAAAHRAVAALHHRGPGPGPSRGFGGG